MAFDNAKPGVAMVAPLGEKQGKASAHQNITQASIPPNVRFMEVN